MSYALILLLSYVHLDEIKMELSSWNGIPLLIGEVLIVHGYNNIGNWEVPGIGHETHSVVMRRALSAGSV